MKKEKESMNSERILLPTHGSKNVSLIFDRVKAGNAKE